MKETANLNLFTYISHIYYLQYFSHKNRELSRFVKIKSIILLPKNDVCKHA